MARLIYDATISLDGFVSDEAGNIDWTEPSEQVSAFVNEIQSQVGTYLLGRRMAETMAVWDRPEDLPPMGPAALGFAPIWRAAEKIVHSTTSPSVSLANARLERSFDSEAVLELKRHATRDLVIGGPTLAAHAIRAGLVDEYQVFVAPVVLGGGTPYLPDDVRLSLELLDERRFDNGCVYLRYGVQGRPATPPAAS